MDKISFRYELEAMPSRKEASADCMVWLCCLFLVAPMDRGNISHWYSHRTSQRKGTTMKAFVSLAVVCLFAAVLLPASCQAEEKPIQISFLHPLQIFDAATSISGIRLNLIYGVNQDLTGIDCGFVNKLRGNVSGYQSGVVNLVDGSFEGLQDGIVNVVRGRFVGLQSGFFNSAGDFNGVQCGIWNQVETLHGLQIGLLNFNKSGEPMGFFPIVNFAF